MRASGRSGKRGTATGGAVACLGAALVAVGALPADARADIHRCLEADGTVHYTNVRPRGARCTVIVRERGDRAAAGSTGGVRRAPGQAPAGPDRLERYAAHFREAAALYHLPEALLHAVARVESAFNPSVVSPKGAMGLMQLMPATASAMGVRDPFDPRQNILGGARFLRILANRFGGDLVLTIAAYNAGDGAVLRYNGVPPYTETRRYVRRVLEHYYSYRTAGEPGGA